MSSLNSKLRTIGVTALLSIVLSTCGEPVELDIPITKITPSPTTVTQVIPTELPPPPKTLVVCLGQEPTSLYLYSTDQPETDTILQAIYDGPIDLRGYQYQPVILTKLPAFEDGDAVIEVVEVEEGDIYLNPETQQPDILESGKFYLPANCSSTDCLSEYDGGSVEVDRLVVDFELLPDLLWSDGEPLTMNDSVFSFNIDAHDDTPSTKYLVHRTSSYEALDDRHVRWISIPGFIDPDFQANFWSPLPEHILHDLSPRELLTAEQSSQSPIGWGPYIIDSWNPGVEIILRRSETYFRTAEGLPHFDLLRLRFLGSDYISALEQVLTGECDLLDETIFSSSLWGNAQDYADQGRLIFESIPGAVMQRIDFNIDGGGTTHIFSDLRMRQAFTGCLDRQRLISEALMGLSTVPDSYLPPGHPYYQTDPDYELATLDQAMELLQAVGWLDEDGDPLTPRVSRGVIGIPDGTPLEVSFFTTDDYFSEITTPMIEENLAQCGFNIVPEFGEADELFEPWPNGPIFGGRFDLVSWAWPTFTSPPCEMFAGFEVPNVDYIYGINATGFRNYDYDKACLEILTGGIRDDSVLDAIATTERIFREEMPAIPLYVLPKVIVYSKELCGPRLDPTTFSTIWNLEEFGIGDSCES